jgi:hypothetical protein
MLTKGVESLDVSQIPNVQNQRIAIGNLKNDQ